MPTRFKNGIGEGPMIVVSGVDPVADNDEIQIYVPFDLWINGVAVRANEVTNAGSEVSVDVQDDGSSILSAAINVAAVDTTYQGTLSPNEGTRVKVDEGSILTVRIDLTGTGALGQFAVTIW